MSENKMRLGDTLVEAGVITHQDLGRALAIQKERQLRLGTILLQEGFVTESQLVQALSLKLSIPWVSLWRIDIPDELLQMVPANVAEEFFLMPIYMRTVATGERALYVAMNDPTDENALRFVQASAGMPVKPMIAGPSDIAAAIRYYYYDEEVDGPYSSVPPPPPMASASPAYPARATAPPVPPQAGKSTPISKPPKPPPTPQAAIKEEAAPAEDDEIEALSEEDLELESNGAEDEVDETPEQVDEPDETTTAEPSAAKPSAAEPSAAEPSAAEPETPEPAQSDEPEDKVFADKTAAQREAERRLFGVGRTKPKRTFSLTLLDGTTLSFGPSASEPPPAALSPEKITQKDLIAGLKAAAEGTPIQGFLPSDRWEAYVGALLSVLLRKHLVMFDELREEINKFSKP